MKLQNKAMLITYPDSLGHNLKDLSQVMDRYFSKAIGGIHLLPLFPSHGDRGFTPMTYEKVAPEFGTWSDVEKLGEQYYLMFDFMINHISAHSDYYLDLQKNKEKSPWRDLFLSWDKFWPADRPTQADVDLIYKRKDKAPWEELEFADGSREKMWNTFGPDQIDLDVRTEVTKRFVKETLQQLVKHQASLIRLDAFALPMVLLYSLYTGKSQRLAAWLKQCPMKQFTTLDTHDGLGVVDAKDILTDEEIDYTTQELYKVGANVKRKYSSAEYNNLDIYQSNTTYYSALGNDDQKYFLARLLQVFAPGIPQIYYVGLLAGENDLDLLERTKEGRNINRHYYSLEEIDQEVKRPVVAKLLKLLEFRNTEAAFDLDGRLEVAAPSEHEIILKRVNQAGDREAVLRVDLAALTYQISVNGEEISL